MATNDQKKQAREKREQAQLAAQAAATRNRNLSILGGVVVAAVAVVILVVILSGGRDTPSTGAADGGKLEGVAETKTLLDGIEQQGLTLGDPKAPVTIVEFLDVQCPYCRDHQLDTQPQLIKDLVRTGKARITAQPVALPMMGEDSVAGQAVTLRLAQKNKAWNFLNLFYFNQGQEQTGYVTDDYLKQLVKAAGGTDADAVRTPDDATIASAEKIEKLTTDLEVSSTPAFAVGKSSQPASTYKTLENSDTIVDDLKAAVEEASK